MDGYRLDLSSPPDWQPLEQLASLLRTRIDLPHIVCSDFMYMGKLEAEASSIHLYKHRGARTYLCIDHSGHTFRIRTSASHLKIALAEVATEVHRVAAPIRLSLRKPATLDPLRSGHGDDG